MTRTTTPRTSRRRSRAVALSVTAAAATAASVGVGLALPQAQADPGDTFVPIGTSQLIQSEDLAAIIVPLDTERVVLNRDTDFSSCLGAGNSWTEVLPGSPKPITATWTRRHHPRQALSESIAQAATPARARHYARTLVDAGIRACQGGPTPYNFHYGRLHSSGVGSGSAIWALSFRGDRRRPDGGVVVIRKGTNVGFLQVHGRFGSARQTMESVAKVAVSRLR